MEHRIGDNTSDKKLGKQDRNHTQSVIITGWLGENLNSTCNPKDCTIASNQLMPSSYLTNKELHKELGTK